ncbi:Grx4 family monothiol glutaredoxin [Corallococcus interemptor]|uniref:Grx4 family monothiol glutaredoxin n=1 Tax=Corallococcus interemptor TaxID=2316720 RepID=UPI003CFEA3C0
MDPTLKAQFDETVKSHPIVLFMKGNALFPQCGFSARALQLLQQTGTPVHTVDVLADPNVRQGIKDYSNWPTIPQIYIHGKFVGGSDILMELAERGELQDLVAAGGK